MTTWLSTREAARRLRLSRKHVGYLARTGALPAVKVGHRWRVTEQAVDDYARTRAS